MHVIFGAAGKAGRATAMALRRAALPVRAVVRDAAQGDALAKMGCEIAVADLHDVDALSRALDGAHAVQMLIPLPRDDPRPADTMRSTIDIAARALAAHRDAHVLALSDYGAELDTDTGITMLFHHFEAALRDASAKLTLLRSAEHMQNWMRVLPVALSSGVLPSFHDPVDKRFPTISAGDVGVVSARLLSETSHVEGTRIVSVEGPSRVSAIDVAQSISDASGRPVKALALPRDQWAATLARGGLSDQHARLIIELFDAHNAGRIDVEEGVGERAFGTTKLRRAVEEMVAGIEVS
ncbi:NmrA family transcriptional regulator [Caballeronia novacaledonica]|uniref:NmrA family transcriptional regulator n=1 Tax=Caballeronia novacaledonica TaxID=1544861 RepID=A0A2U3IC41_9BURK|nr:NAD(P)H-binding protein [Caballeronia novacaledonica]SPB17691.1 NmrA family transcriptional regulator [Caballeronia novacaledonica]